MNILTLVIIAALTMLCLAVGLILFVVIYQRRVINHQQQLKDLNRKKQEELIQASIRSEEEERMRIAAELHDDVGATLSSIRLMLHQVGRHATPQSAPAVQQVQSLLDDCIQKVRNLSHQLQPGTLQYLGLAKSLQSLAELLNRSGQISVRFHEAEGWPSLPAEPELALYRIVQELLNNIIKHAGASSVHIETAQEAGTALIRIRHNGHGLTNETYHEMLYKKGAIGLKNIESRLRAARASITFPVPEDAQFSAGIVLSLQVAGNEAERS
jgi:signal transduction histidine kinase